MTIAEIVDEFQTLDETSVRAIVAFVAVSAEEDLPVPPAPSPARKPQRIGAEAGPAVFAEAGDRDSTFPGKDIGEDQVAGFNAEQPLASCVRASQRKLVERPVVE